MVLFRPAIRGVLSELLNQRLDMPDWTARAKKSYIHRYVRHCFAGLSASASAILTRSANDFAPIFFITLPR